VPTVDWCNIARVTIDRLPDLALLETFHFYVDEERIKYEEQIDAWQTLVHVCRKWRIVVFGSPHRLGLRLRCSASTPVREMLDVWPLLPIVIIDKEDEKWGVDDIIAALEHNDRICELKLWLVPSSRMDKVLEAMQQPFPELTTLCLQPKLGETTPILSASFLGGSAPRLHALWLDYISFPGLPKLLLSATHLVHLTLRNIPPSGYISPEAMVTSLSVLTRLEKLDIGFVSPRSRPDQKSRRPSTRTLLPVLTKLRFKGTSECFEDFVARINAPLLDNLMILFFNRLISNTQPPQLAGFISRTPKFNGHDEARVVFSDWLISVIFPQTSDGTLELAILPNRSHWQLSFLAEICSLSIPQTLLTVEHLYILGRISQMYWLDDIESNHWVELLHPYTAVKELYLSQQLVPRIAPVLQELVGERVTEVLPALRALFLEEPLPSGPVQEAIGQFVDARQLAGNPITVSCWKGVENV
jgi:hypothetical protein